MMVDQQEFSDTLVLGGAHHHPVLPRSWAKPSSPYCYSSMCQGLDSGALVHGMMALRKEAVPTGKVAGAQQGLCTPSDASGGWWWKVTHLCSNESYSVTHSYCPLNSLCLSLWSRSHPLLALGAIIWGQEIELGLFLCLAVFLSCPKLL